MSVAATELTSLIGLPWVAGARGADSYDCWGMFLAVQRDHFGRDLPEIPVDALDLRAVLDAFSGHPERQRWQSVPQPEEGDAVLMREVDDRRQSKQADAIVLQPAQLGGREAPKAAGSTSSSCATPLRRLN